MTREAAKSFTYYVLSDGQLMEFEKAQARVAELEREVEKLKQNSCDLRTALLGVVSLAVEREHYPESYWQYKFTDETRQRYERIVAANEQ